MAAAQPKASGPSNPYNLPRGEKLRRELVKVFGAQRKSILRYLKAGKKGQAPPLPPAFPGWEDFRLGALAVSERMTPLLTLTWEAAAARFAPRVGLDPDAWEVVNPHTERMIEEAALAFSRSTNETTSKQLDEALAELREQLQQGIVQQGEALSKLTERVNAIFDQASSSRARRIAWTETSRAVHAAQEQAAIKSGVVTGWKWLASGDACPTCVAIAARCPFVPLGRPFAVIGDDPNYATIKYPPAHPHCMCTVVEVLDTDDQPQWSMTLHDPEPATDEEKERVGDELMQGYDEILRPTKRRPAPARRPAPLARKRRRTPQASEIP